MSYLAILMIKYVDEIETGCQQIFGTGYQKASICVEQPFVVVATRKGIMIEMGINCRSKQ